MTTMTTMMQQRRPPPPPPPPPMPQSLYGCKKPRLMRQSRAAGRLGLFRHQTITISKLTLNKWNRQALASRRWRRITTIFVH